MDSREDKIQRDEIVCNTKLEGNGPVERACEAEDCQNGAHLNAILKEIWHIKLIKNYKWMIRDSNRVPLAPKSNALTTRLCKRDGVAFLGWLLLPLLWQFL